MFRLVIRKRVLWFLCNTSNVQLVADTLRAELIKTVQQKPYLAGSLAREDKPLIAGRLKLTYPYDGCIGLGFSVNDLTSRPEVWGIS